MGTNNIFIEFVSLFVSYSDSNRTSVSEDFSEVIFSYTGVCDKIPTQQSYDNAIAYLNERDSLHISCKKEETVIENFDTITGNTFISYVESLKTGGLEVGDTLDLIVTVTKNKENDRLSIYYLDKLTQYLESVSLSIIISIFDKYLNKEKLIFECQIEDSEINILTTNTIAIIGKSRTSLLNGIGDINRDNRIHNARTMCHWDVEDITLLPEDFYPYTTNDANNELIEIFRKICILYSCMFVFDYSKIAHNSFIYKLNGYKTLGNTINTSQVKDITINSQSFDLFHKIYQWAYLGGNTNDKISIARNIISLNFDPNTLYIAETTLEAIQSNFKIYERENVKQYIAVRNKLSELLIELQSKIEKITDGFIGDFKKSIITLLSFFISVIVIRVVSKGDFIGGFTNEILILSFSFILISIGILLYSRWEFTRKISMFEKHYSQLRDRYKDLLSAKELESIFDQCNPQDKLNNKSFVQEQKKHYTRLWIWSIIVLTISLIVIFIMNNQIYFHCFLNLFNRNQNVI